MDFNRKIFYIAKKLHEEKPFDLAHHVTYSTWRVGSPLWRLGIPFIWGPISGTEIFPLISFGSMLSTSAKAFELLRVLGGLTSRISNEVRLCAKHAFHIFAAHSEAVTQLAELRGSKNGISVLSYYAFDRATIASFERPTFQMTNDPLNILAGGNLEGRKGIAIALNGLAIARKQGAEFLFNVTGRGPELEYLLKLSAALGLDKHVTIGQAFPRNEYVSRLRETDIYLLPSLREGGGLTMMEAMLAGCVPIVANCGGPGTAVTDDCGFRIAVQSPDQMANDIASSIMCLYHNRDLLQTMGRKAANRISTTYAQENFLKTIQAIYETARNINCKQ